MRALIPVFCLLNESRLHPHERIFSIFLSLAQDRLTRLHALCVNKDEKFSVVYRIESKYEK